jgi:cytochrome P450
MTVDVVAAAGNVVDPYFWERSEASLRRFFEAVEASPLVARRLAHGKGDPVPYYALTRWQDVAQASHDPVVFSSARGATSLDDMPPAMRRFFDNLMEMDDPRHRALRLLISRQLTPPAIAAHAGMIVTEVDRQLDVVLEAGRCDFVEVVASRVPIGIIATLLGVPRSEHERLRSCAAAIAAARREEAPEFVSACEELSELALGLRRRLRSGAAVSPLFEAIAVGAVGERPITPAELCSYFIILVFAGSHTTRIAGCAGLRLLSTHLEQRARWTASPQAHGASGVEEVLRLATPVRFLRRTVTAPVAIGGRTLLPGDIAMLVYWGANRDSEVFERPYEFVVDRSPNRHFAFGGPGPHVCLGAHLARRTLRTLFERILARAPDLGAVPDPRLGSGFLGGVQTLPCDRDALKSC